MLAGELKELLKNIPDEREVRVLIGGLDSPPITIFDLGYDGELDVEVIMAENK